MSEHTTLRIDCHVHTDDSFDSPASLESVLASAATAGLDGIVVTDHDEIGNALSAVDRAAAHGIVAVPGVEVSTADGHVLAVGVESCPPRGTSFRDTVAWIREAGGVAVVPHPFQRTRHGVAAATITDCDGIEVFNAHTLTGLRNRQAGRFARREGYPAFAGSDAHRAENVGRAYTEVPVETRAATAADVVDAMRAGRTCARGRRLSPGQYVRKLAGSAKRNSARLLRPGRGDRTTGADGGQYGDR